MVAYNDGTTQMLRGGRLFATMADANYAVEVDIADIGRMTTAIMAAWSAYFEASGPVHKNCPCTVEPRGEEHPAPAVREPIVDYADEAHCPHGSRRITSCEDCLVRERGGDLTPAMKEMFDRERADLSGRKAFEARVLDTATEMGSESLSPDVYEGLVNAVEQMRKNRHLG
jgi:hypothetical protein